MQTAMSGGRRLTRGALAGRELALGDPGRSVSRKELAQIGREAEKALSLRPTLRLVLNELIGVWGEQDVQERLLVWPSNEYIVDRTGLSERAIRNALRGLTELKVITPKDSANGKRYGLRNAAGEVIDAYGFDLTPLYARRGEFTQMVLEQKALRDAQGRMFDLITICRRASEEAVSALRSAFPDASADDLERAIADLSKRTPRRGSMAPLHEILEAWTELRTMTEERFYKAGNAGTSCRHKETNNDIFSEPCNKGFRKEAESVRQTKPPPEHLSTALIIEACPAIKDYVGAIRSEADFVAAGRALRVAFGAHETAWQEALHSLGALRAAAAAAYVLQIHIDDIESGANRIKNPGGYFRALVRMIVEHRFHLATELLTLRRRHMS